MPSNGQGSAVINGSYNDTDLSSPVEVTTARRVFDPSNRVPAAPRLLRVLVADDNRDAANTLSLLVKAWGHEVQITYDGAAALKMALSYQPDVLLLDIAMPLMDGYRLARQLRGQPWSQDTLMIAVTGYADAAHHLLGLEAGFHQFLVKPVEPTVLKNLLKVRSGQERLPEVLAVRRELPNIQVVDDVTAIRGVLV